MLQWTQWTMIPQYSERKLMPSIKITAEVDGKQVPLETISVETFKAIKALEKSKKIPVARLATFDGERRLIFKVTESIVKHKDEYVAIDFKCGNVQGYWSSDDDKNCGNGYGYNYKNIKPL